MGFQAPGLCDLAKEPVAIAKENMRLNRVYNHLLEDMPKGNGRPVLVLPGFMESDYITRSLRGYLKDLGYNAHGWKGGVNTGLGRDVHDHLLARVEALYDKYQYPVALIGHSLGGLYARLVAHQRPDHVDTIITSGTPFAASEDLNIVAWHARALYNAINIGEIEFDISAFQQIVKETPQLPTTSIYTRKDGVVDWRGCLHVGDDDRGENVEVATCHVAMLFNAESYCIIGDRLAQDPQDWQPFDSRRYPALRWPTMHCN